MVSGNQGVLYVLTTSTFKLTTTTVLKTMALVPPGDTPPDHLLYEYVVGIQINKFTATPNVITTLNLYKFKNIQSYKICTIIKTKQ